MLVEFEILLDGYNEILIKVLINPSFVQHVFYVEKYNSPFPNLVDTEYTVIVMADNIQYKVKKPIDIVKCTLKGMSGKQNALGMLKE